MSVERTRGTFEPEEWKSQVGHLSPSVHGAWSTRDVIGPRDACWILHMRRLVRPFVNFGAPVPTDMFLLGIGESIDRAGTKIGGLPYWPVERDWPQSQGGEPLPFLAQFCFRDSAEFVGDLPEDLLLLFGFPDVPSTIVARWQAYACRSVLVEHDSIPNKTVFPCFHGIRWRTENYPDAQYPTSIRLGDGTRVHDIPFILQLMGMQISRKPYFPRWERHREATGHVVCGMASVFPIANRPCPFVNRSEPLTQAEAEELAVQLTDRPGDGFGTLCVVTRDSGETDVLVEDL
jgi:Domain of unknown function (DUF1963)